MRLALLIFLLFQVGSFIAHADTPACVRAKEAKVLLTLNTSKKTSGKKSKRKSASVKSASQAEPPITMPMYTPVKWTGKREGRWMEVQTMDNKTYWIRKRDLSFEYKCLVVLVQKSRMYMGPGNQFEKAEIAEKGDVFLDLGGEDGWTQVQNADGKKSWINLDHTWKPAATLRMTFAPEK